MANINKETILTQEYVKFLFTYKDGILYWENTKCVNGQAYKGKRAGVITKTHSGLRTIIRIGKYCYYSNRLIFFYHNGWWPEMVDHEDRDTLNDRVENLRAADGFKNAANVKKKDNTSSKYMGVFYSKKITRRRLKTTGEIKEWSNPKWVAQISHKNKRITLGNYKTEIEAALAYNKGAVKYHGEFANLNIIML